MTHRRDFLRFLGTTAAAGALMPKRALASGASFLSADAAAIRQLGVQLYTVRGAMEKDGVEKTLARVAAIGYKEVEFAGYYGRTAAQIRATLRANGLTSPSVHVPLQQLTSPDFPKFVADAALIGHKWIILAWLAPPDRGSVEKYNAHADALLAAQGVASAAGITIGYHNHEFEFEPLGSTDGYEILLERTKGSAVQFEMDLYWMSVAGKDPISYWSRFPGRFPLVHVKDNAGAPKNEITPVGSGSIQWATLFAKRNVAGIKHFYVEHDNPPDPFASLTSSFGYLKKLRFT